MSSSDNEECTKRSLGDALRIDAGGTAEHDNNRATSSEATQLHLLAFSAAGTASRGRLPPEASSRTRSKSDSGIFLDESSTNDDFADDCHPPLEKEQSDQEKAAQAASRFDYDETWDLVGQRRQLWEEPPRLRASETTRSAPTTPRGEATTERARSLGSLYGPLSSRSSATTNQRRRATGHQYCRYRPKGDDDRPAHSDTHITDGGWEQRDSLSFSHTPDFLDMPTMTTTMATTTSTPRQRRDSETMSDSAISESMDTTSSTGSGSGSMRRRQAPISLRSSSRSSGGSVGARRPGGIPETINESSGLRASLDAGMSRLRRWIRSPSAGMSVTAANQVAQHQQQPPHHHLHHATTSAHGRPRTASLSFDDTERARGAARVMSLPQRQRALSEPDGQMRDFVFQHYEGASLGSSHGGNVEALSSTGAANNSSSNRSTASSQAGAASTDNNDIDGTDNREARVRWVRINRRFQLTITIVALIFSLLLFSILVCWVVMTSSYVISIDKKCDVPLKAYFWLATLQLILDVFRTDIMRFVCQWESNSSDRIPVRVILYNLLYLVYALLVLRLGVKSVFINSSTCRETAPELFQSTAVFVSLSIAAWSTIVLGYLVPFCFVATLLTWNGYTPAADRTQTPANGAGPFGVFPTAFSREAAPLGTIDQMRSIVYDASYPDEYPRECCICMTEFCTDDAIVATECDHVFHRRCCQEWLRQARTCPVCRTDIPDSLDGRATVASTSQPETAPGDSGGGTGRARGRRARRENFTHEILSLFRLFRRQEMRYHARNRQDNQAAQGGAGGSAVELTTRTSTSSPTSTTAADVEDARSVGSTSRRLQRSSSTR